MIDEVRKIEKD